MQPDLEQLYITKEELQQLSGISRRDWKAYEKLNYPHPAILLIIAEYSQQILLLGWGLIPLSYLIKWKWRRKSLRKILDKVDKYNTILKAIDISDRLKAAGNQGASLRDREKSIPALESVRNSLVCALKTERILRENKAFISRNSQLFINNLLAPELEVSDRATEYGRLLNEALQVAVDVREEMKKLEQPPSQDE